MTQIRAFNEAGIEKFRSYLQSLKEGTVPEISLDNLISDQEYSVPVDPPVEVEKIQFSSKYEIAEYLHKKISPINPARRFRDIGMWTWLAAFYFDTVCPLKSGQSRKIKAETNYILNSSQWDRLFRHLLAGSVMIYDLHGENSWILLYNRPSESGDFLAQLTGRQVIGTNKSIIGAAGKLYWDAEKKRPKRGASPQEHKPGTLRRFVDVLLQFELTYDLYSISGDELIQLLPEEFRSWSSVTSQKENTSTPR